MNEPIPRIVISDEEATKLWSFVLHVDSKFAGQHNLWRYFDADCSWVNDPERNGGCNLGSFIGSGQVVQYDYNVFLFYGPEEVAAGFGGIVMLRDNADDILDR